MSSENISTMVDSSSFLVRVSHLITFSVALPNGFVAWKFLSSFLSIFTSFAVYDLIVTRVLPFVCGGYVFYPSPFEMEAGGGSRKFTVSINNSISEVTKPVW